MKKCFSISLALLILVSGMHITIASHFCGGFYVASRVSVTGKLATCGMSHDSGSAASSDPVFSSNCCENKISVYAVESEYSPAAYLMKRISQVVQQNFIVPEGFSFQSKYTSTIIPIDYSPPDYSLPNALSLASIGVFRI